MLTSAATSVPSLPQLLLPPEDRLSPTSPRKASRAPGGAAPAAPRPAALASSAARPRNAARTSSASRSAAAKKAKTTGAGYAKPASSSAKRAGPLAFLDDPKLSVEQKLLKLLGYLNDKWNKELDQKMKDFKQTSTTTTTSAGSSRSSSSGGIGGLFKKAVGFASVAIPGLGVQLEALRSPALLGAVKAVAGPALAALATSAGQPELAPFALKYGPDVVDALAGAVTSATAPAPSPAAAAATGGTPTPKTTTRESADGLGSDRNDQLKLMEMQRILDQQKEMFSLVSNMLRTTHDARMAVIQNVR